jgi:hypothetical protein
MDNPYAPAVIAAESSRKSMKGATEFRGIFAVATG